MVVMRTIHCTLITDQLLTCLTVVDKWTFMMNAITKWRPIYADGGAVGKIDETSDWPSSFLTLEPFLDLVSFSFFSFLEGVFDYFSLLLDFPDLGDFSDLSSFFFLLFESLPIWIILFYLNYSRSAYVKSMAKIKLGLTLPFDSTLYSPFQFL